MPDSPAISGPPAPTEFTPPSPAEAPQTVAASAPYPFRDEDKDMYRKEILGVLYDCLVAIQPPSSSGAPPASIEYPSQSSSCAAFKPAYRLETIESVITSYKLKYDSASSGPASIWSAHFEVLTIDSESHTACISDIDWKISGPPHKGIFSYAPHVTQHCESSEAQSNQVSPAVNEP